MFRHALGPDAWLRPLRIRHAAELHAVVEANREHLRRWLPWVDASESVEQTRAYLREIQSRAARDDAITLGIWTAEGLRGVVGFHLIEWFHRRTSLGYWLAADAQGRGLMTRAVRALLDHAFGDLGLNRVELAAATGNTRSRAIAERLGFTFEGVRRQCEWLYDHFVDHAVYSMLAAEWTDAA